MDDIINSVGYCINQNRSLQQYHGQITFFNHCFLIGCYLNYDNTIYPMMTARIYLLSDFIHVDIKTQKPKYVFTFKLYGNYSDALFMRTKITYNHNRPYSISVLA